MGNEYQALHKYLQDRFADRIVLTFGEIEDLVGFPLPAEARQDATWWVSADPSAPRSPVADAWTLASRTAVVNMASQSIAFERETTVDAWGRRR
jgi:hypothetical protein